MKLKKSITPLIFTNAKALRSWISITLILFLAAMLYFYQLGTESLWIDEIFSIQYARDNNIFSFSLNRPLYFILLHFWMRLSSNEAWLRGLSVIFGLGSVFLTYILACRLYNRTTGLIAALLLTLSPLVINHSQEIRMYMLSMFLGLGGSLALTFFLERPKFLTCFWWLGLRILAVLTTPINTLLLIPDTALLRWKFNKQAKLTLTNSRKWFWLSGILIIPSIIILKDVVPPLIDFLEGKNLDHKIGITAFFGGITRMTIWHLESPLEQLSWFYEHIFFNLYAFVLIILLVVAWLNWKKSIGLWWAIAWGFGPLIMIFSLSQVFTTLWGVDRYLLFTAPYIFIVLAIGFIKVWHWRKTAALIITVIYIMVVGGALVRYYTLPYREDWRGAVQKISVNENPGDVIALFPNNYLPVLNYYYQGNSPIYTLERLPKEKVFQQIDKLFFEQMLRDLPQIKSRLWLVFASANTGFNDKNQVVETVVNEQFDVETYQIFNGIKLFLIKSLADSQQTQDFSIDQS